MDFESKKKYLDTLQKSITSACFNNCYNLKTIETDCLDNCFENFIETINEVNNLFKSKLKFYDSKYYYKFYSKKNILMSKLIYSDDFIPYKFEQYDLFLEYDYKNDISH